MSSKETPLTYFGSLVFDDAVKWANAFVWFRYQYCNIYSPICSRQHDRYVLIH